MTKESIHQLVRKYIIQVSKENILGKMKLIQIKKLNFHNLNIMEYKMYKIYNWMEGKLNN